MMNERCSIDKDHDGVDKFPQQFSIGMFDSASHDGRGFAMIPAVEVRDWGGRRCVFLLPLVRYAQPR